MEIWKVGRDGLRFSSLGRVADGDDILEQYMSRGYACYNVPKIKGTRGRKAKYTQKLAIGVYRAFNPDPSAKQTRMDFKDGDPSNCSLDNMIFIPTLTPEERKKQVRSRNKHRIYNVTRPKLEKQEKQVQDLEAVFNRSSIITEELQREIIALRKEVEVLKRYISIQEAACYTFR